MTGIFVGLPCTREYQPFRESLSIFLNKIKNDYNIEVFEIKYHMRDDARNIIVDEFLKSDKDYLLFLDDDHSGHTPEMLESLIKANTMVCSMKCYSRYYPYQITTITEDIKYHDNHSLYVLNKNKGYGECRFLGFGMALISRELFSRIEKPYFKCDKLGEREDNYFCEKLTLAGITPIGCFDYVLTHDGINDSNVLHRRQTGIRKFIKETNQRIKLRQIKEAIKNKEVYVNNQSEGKLNVIDVCLNSEIILA